MNMLDQSLAQLACDVAGATRIFHDYRLDFCCDGKKSLREAAQENGIEGQEIIRQLQALQSAQSAIDWGEASSADLIAHILTRFHERHREQLPELIRLARKVEQVHGDSADCPNGLADHLSNMQQEMESHMQKEERVLFPMLMRGQYAMVGAPIAVMRMEHDQHGAALHYLSTLTHDISLPPAACHTWRALYSGLRVFREDLMEHIHLENNILFENAALAQSSHA